MAFIFLGKTTLEAQKLSRIEKKIVQKVKTYEVESVAFLEKVVNINSGTMHLEGVRAVGREFNSAGGDLLVYNSAVAVHNHTSS